MNILLIVCDTLRADHLGCYGYFRDTSPNIDLIAKEGVLFRDYYIAGSPTGPGFTCIYTGLHTIHHKYYWFGGPNLRQVDDTIFTLPEIMREIGYTAAAVDNLMNFPSHPKHFARGYEFYINPSAGAFTAPAEMKSERVNKRLLPWIRAHSDEEFFLFVHYWDPHAPYMQPEPYRTLFHHEKGNLSDLDVEESPAGYKYVQGWGEINQIVEGKWRGGEITIDLYDGAISYMNRAIGEVIDILEKMGILDETLVIVTADHGEQLGQHNWWAHNSLHDSIAHIPLIMRYPKKLPKGVEVQGFCQHIVLLPTILDLIGAPTDVLEIDGESILPLLRGKEIRNQVFMECASSQRAVRTSEWKLIVDEWSERLHKEPELYNVKEDPMEIENITNTRREVTGELTGILRGWVKNNLQGEKDPVTYNEEWEGHPGGADEYRQKVKSRLEPLKKLSERHKS